MSTKEEIVERIEALRKQLHHHNRMYYIEDNPEISDAEYDAMMRELIEMEKAYPELITPDSPSQRVGAPRERGVEAFTTVKHAVPMLSLDNTYSKEEVLAFDTRVKKALPDQNDIEYVVEPKVDGVAVSLRYESSIFVQGSTRGNGLMGDNITANLKTIRTIPLRLEGDTIPLLEVRGEVFMPRKAFEKLNEERVASSQEPFANPRNATAGSLKLLDPRISARRKLDIVVHTPGQMEGVSFNTHFEFLEEIGKRGLKANRGYKLCIGIEEAMRCCESWEENHADGVVPYDIDGMVIKVNRLELHDLLGATSKSPRWAVAFKFKARQASTVLKDIVVQVGRTGVLTPVAIFEPVRLGGTVISRATLHNADEIKRKDIRIGDTVLIEKGGEVIPKVVKAVLTKRSGAEKVFTMPQRCPVCSAHLVKVEGEVAIRCENIACPAQLRNRLKHFASRGAMDIEGLGHTLIEQLVDKALVKDVADIYNLDVDAVANLERMGDKSTKNVIEAIEKSKKMDFSRLLFGIGIPYVGSKAADILAEHFPTMRDLSRAAAEQLEAIPEIGPRTAESIVRFFREGENATVIEKLRAVGVNMASQASAQVLSPTATRKSEIRNAQSAIRGRTFVLTGALQSLTRHQAEEEIKTRGGKVSSSVSRKTDYVVVGESPGSKYDKAMKLNVRILSEQDFANMLR
ncbi:NAD-dependent DNA ligase LigA [bacterium]|nr:NAD-dependent DNA ligase LigA [bacterium]